MARELDKNFNFKEEEKKLYEHWYNKGYFTPKVDKKKQPFTIVIPPPNVTGQLHMGHALDETLQDILIRFKRMQGYATLWVPGTDHAGIATQIKVEENLRKEKGLSRYDLGREKFTELVWEWKNKYGSRIIEQLKSLGSSCDWSRLRFTMDDNLSAAVKKVFVSLYDKGLIYRGFRIINYCPKCATALSDAEVEHKDKEGSFWHIRYQIKDTNEYIVVATTRPETYLGDTAIAVHPEDERYAKFVGKTAIIPLVGREIPIIADEYVDKDFGTGCVKITPCHDPNDFEVGQRHNLEMITVFDNNAKINENGGKYEGLDRFEARKQIVNDLNEAGYLVKIEPCTHNVGHCYRCGTVVEPMASRQWFVKMEPLAKEAIRVVEDGTIKYIPDRFSKIYLNWMYGIRDWCISRQLWWGHRIPAYYCDDCGEIHVSETAVTVCKKCGSTHITQEEDVLDTWFSSALWPFSTLGWPNNTEDLDFFYPTSTLVTGYDIIPFWVARMITMGMECTKQKPFSNVLIHGLVRDAQGRKMSKSLGNGIDPLEIIDKYGADALRFALITGNAPGNDMRFSDEKVESARNFANKIWNASRFALMNIPDELDTSLPSEDKLRIEDKWILSKLNTLVSEITENLEKYELGIALAKIYDFSWSVLCDWYIEIIKPRLFNKDTEDYITACKVLSYTISRTMELLHPFMPFITETIWQALPHDGESIMIASYPTYCDKFNYSSDEKAMELVISAIKAIRNRRAEMNVPPSTKAALYVVTEEKDVFNSETSYYFEKLASASKVEYLDSFEDSSCIQIISDKVIIYIPLSDIVDFEKELARLKQEKEKMLSEIDRIDKKLSNEGFVSKAPEAVINAEKVKRVGYVDKLNAIEESIKKYSTK